MLFYTIEISVKHRKERSHHHSPYHSMMLHCFSSSTPSHLATMALIHKKSNFKYKKKTERKFNLLLAETLYYRKQIPLPLPTPTRKKGGGDPWPAPAPPHLPLLTSSPPLSNYMQSPPVSLFSSHLQSSLFPTCHLVARFSSRSLVVSYSFSPQVNKGGFINQV